MGPVVVEDDVDLAIGGLVFDDLRHEGLEVEALFGLCGTDPQFAAKAADIIGLYLNPPENALVLSVDEKPSIQALERFCASNQAVLYVMPSWASSWTADMPLECVAMRCDAQNHTVSGNFDRCITVPAVTDVWRPQSRHS